MYLLDADVLMDAANRYYAFDLAPNFWTWLEGRHHAGDLCSVVAIRDEVQAGRGDLATWASQLDSRFWLADSSASLGAVGRLAGWAADPQRQYRPAAVAEFMGSGDIRLIAAAAAGDHTVVTHEQPRPEAVRRIMIPDACDALRVRWASPFPVFRHLGLRL